MSRRSVPRISSTDLREHADHERVERVWQRLEASLPAADARPVRRVHWATIAAAAALFAFGGGVAVGKGWSRSPAPSVLISETIDRSATDVLAAGESTRTFPLEGGGHITLKPGSIVEVQRAAGGVTLKLAQGDATLETPGGGAGPTVVVGDARLDTQASSTVTVSRHLDNIDVGVSRGGASVASPAMNKTLASGENISLPVRTASLTPTATPAVAMGHHGAHHAEIAAPEMSGTPLAAAPASDWKKAYAANDYKKAAELFQQERGEFDPAVSAANSAQELYELYTLAQAARQATIAKRALRRAADDFPAEQYGQLSAHQLCDAGEGPKYCEGDKNSPLYDAEGAACRVLTQTKNKDEAAKLAREYVKNHPDGGKCRDEALRISSGATDEPGDAPTDAGAAKGDKPKPPPKP